MGGLCSKSAKGDKELAKKDERKDNHKSGGRRYEATMPGDLVTAPQIREKNKQEHGAENEGTGPDDFYDGIPRFTDSFPHKSRSVRSRQAAVAKVGLMVLSCSVSSFFFRFITFFNVTNPVCP